MRELDGKSEPHTVSHRALAPFLEALRSRLVPQPAIAQRATASVDHREQESAEKSYRPATRTTMPAMRSASSGETSVGSMTAPAEQRSVSGSAPAAGSS